MKSPSRPAQMRCLRMLGVPLHGVAFLTVVLALAPAGCRSTGRGGEPTLAHLEFIAEYFRTKRFTLGQPRAITVVPGGGAVLFLRSPPDSFVEDLHEHSVATGNERVLATAAELLGGKEEELSPEEKARRERQRLTSRGIASYVLSEDGERVLIPLSGRLFVLERSSGDVQELKMGGTAHPLDPRFSPDGRYLSFVREGDLHVLELRTGEEKRLTRRSSPTVTYGLAEFVAQEEMDRHRGYWWSPDSRLIACQESDTAGMEVFHIADPSRPEVEPEASPYPRAGKKNAEVKLLLLPAEGGGQAVAVDWDRMRYPYLARVVWSVAGPLTILVQDREQQEEVVLAVEPRDGSTRKLLVETDPAWLNLHGSLPRWLPDGSGFLWISERDAGYPRLELHQPDGSLDRVLTPERFPLIALLAVDPVSGEALVTAAAEPSGRPDPTQRHLFRLPLKGPLEGGSPRAVSSQRGLHDAAVVDDGSALVRISHTFEGDVSWTVHRREGPRLGPRLEAAGELRSVARVPPFLPRVEILEVGEDKLRAAVVYPRDFRPGPRCPVLVSVYGGPHAQTVLAGRRGYLLHQWFADQGFIVVSIDGRGTPGRGRAWERAIRLNFIDAPLEDQVAGLRGVAAQAHGMDLSRVGIYGWSFGGYFSAMAVQRRPEVYHAAVAGAPVTDWHDYDTHYTERYLGLPEKNPQGYAASSALARAGELRRPLLLVHGTADDNVYFLHALKLSWELFKTERSFEFVPLAGQTHVVARPEVAQALQERAARFFLRHLGRPEGREGPYCAP